MLEDTVVECPFFFFFFEFLLKKKLNSISLGLSFIYLFLTTDLSFIMKTHVEAKIVIHFDN